MGMLLLRHAEWVFHLGMNNHNAALSDGIGGALWLPKYAGDFPAFLLEEGCHSAGFVATIHVRHHLLLSLGWQLIVCSPE